MTHHGMSARTGFRVLITDVFFYKIDTLIIRVSHSPCDMSCITGRIRIAIAG